jgi:hypothetical protein
VKSKETQEITMAEIITELLSRGIWCAEMSNGIAGFSGNTEKSVKVGLHARLISMHDRLCASEKSVTDPVKVARIRQSLADVDEALAAFAQGSVAAYEEGL